MFSLTAPFFLASLLVLLTATADGGGEPVPVFMSKPLTLKVAQGQDIKLPCQTSSTGSAVITWSWNGRLVSAGDMKVYSDDRIQVLSGGRELVVLSVTRADRGEFSCIVNLKLDTPTLTHRLEVLVAPTVAIDRDAGLDLEEGDRLEVACTGQGFPQPTVNWRKHGQVIPGKMKASTLLLEAVRPEDSGSYECVAENSEGVSRQKLSVTVFYAPRTHVSRLQSPHGQSSTTVLSCKVKAHPKAKVSWSRDGLPVVGGLTHTLTLPNMGEQDYGNYTCVARNRLGTGTDSLMVTGSPDPPEILSPGQGFQPHSYRLEWRVWSPPQFPIMNQSILYRMIRKGRAATSGEPGSWHNLALISDGGQEQGTYSMLLTALEREAEYELRLRAMNRQGWSALSQPFRFQTAGSSRHVDSLSSVTGRQLTSGAVHKVAVGALVTAMLLNL